MMSCKRRAKASPQAPHTSDSLKSLTPLQPHQLCTVKCACQIQSAAGKRHVLLTVYRIYSSSKNSQLEHWQQSGEQQQSHYSKITDVNSRKETRKSRVASNSRDANNNFSISRDANICRDAGISMNASHEFSRKFAKNS